MRIKCLECGKSVSTEVSDGTLIRAYIQCPECVEKEYDKIEKAQELIIDVQQLLCPNRY